MDATHLTRTFIAISFPEEVIEEIARVQEIVSGKAFTGKITELNNLHLTLKFLGELDDNHLDKVKESLKKIKFNKFTVKLGALGTFARHGIPRIVWMKLESKELWELQEKIDLEMKKLGFEREERFMAHVTLARVKYVEDKKGFREAIKSIKTKKIDFDVNDFALKKSELRKMGPTYTDIDVYSANRETP